MLSGVAVLGILIEPKMKYIWRGKGIYAIYNRNNDT